VGRQNIGIGLLGSLLAVVIAGIGLPGCWLSDYPSMVTEVSPVSLPPYSDKPLELTLFGRFHTQLAVSSVSGSVDQLDRFGVWLVPIESDGSAGDRIPAESVTLNGDQLSVILSDGLDAGVYTFVVQDPRGEWATVPESVTLSISELWADHLALQADLYFTQGQIGQIDLRVEDQHGALFEESVNIALYFSNLKGSLYHTTILDPSFKVSNDGRYSHVLTGTIDGSGEATLQLLMDDDADSVLEVQGESMGLMHTSLDESVSIGVLPSDFHHLAVEFLDPDPVSTDQWYTAVAGDNPIAVTARSLNDQLVEVNVEFSIVDLLGSMPVQLPGELDKGRWEGSVSLLKSAEGDDPNLLLAYGPNQTGGYSVYFQVIPGSAGLLKVIMTGEVQPVKAGNSFEVVLTPVDAYGNATPLPDDVTTSVEDDTGTLTCGAPAFGATSVTFSDCVIATTTDANRISGRVNDLTETSALFRVEPGDPVELQVLLQGSQLQVGVPEPVQVRAVDKYGNLVTDVQGNADLSDVPADGVSELQTAPLYIQDGQGQAEITYQALETSAYLQASGSLVVYGANIEVPLSGNSGAYQVLAGISAVLDLEVDVAGQTVAAGDLVTGTLEVFDGYGNPINDYDPSAEGLILTDSTRSVPADGFAVTHLEDNTFLFQFAPTHSGQTVTVDGLDNNGATGSSSSFSVTAGPATSFDIQVADTLIWSNEPFALEVIARDAYQNRAVAYDGDYGRLWDTTTTLTPWGLEQWSGAIGPFEEGYFSGTFYISGRLEANKIQVGGGGSMVIAGATDVSVYDRACPNGVETTLTVNGNTELDYGVACLSRFGQSVGVTFAAAVQAAPAVRKYIWDYGDGNSRVEGQTPQVTHAFKSEGQYRSWVAVIGQDFCAGWDEARVFIGRDEGGRPVGPLQFEPSTLALTAGVDDGSEQAQVTVAATDCSGDSASGTGHLLSVGISVGAVGVVPDDAADNPGLQIELDMLNGTAEVGISMAQVKEASLGTLMVTSESGAASGALEITVSNDRSPPYVVDYWPRGTFEGVVQQIEIWFNEPIGTQNGALEQAEIAVTSSVWGDLEFARDLSADGRVLTLTLPEPLEVSQINSDQVFVHLPSKRGENSVRDDQEGNRLDGNWDGIANDDGDPFDFEFGNLGTSPAWLELINCQIPQAVFSPNDHDTDIWDTEVDEASVALEVASDLGLLAIGLDLRDPLTQESVDWGWTPVSVDDDLSTLSVRWDGRGFEGAVLPNGIYEPWIWLIDLEYNRLEARCTSSDGGVMEELDIEILNPVDMGMYP